MGGFFFGGGGLYFSRSTKVMFSAISATRFAILDAMISYGDGMWFGTPLGTPLAMPFMAGFFGRVAAAPLVEDALVDGAFATADMVERLGVVEVYS